MLADIDVSLYSHLWPLPRIEMLFATRNKVSHSACFPHARIHLNKVHNAHYTYHCSNSTWRTVLYSFPSQYSLQLFTLHLAFLEVQSMGLYMTFKDTEEDDSINDHALYAKIRCLEATPPSYRALRSKGNNIS